MNQQHHPTMATGRAAMPHCDRIIVKKRPDGMAELLLVMPSGIPEVYDYDDLDVIQAKAEALRLFVQDAVKPKNKPLIHDC